MKQSAGILVYRKKGDQVEVLLAHPGGPFWAKKDVWSIPKGELANDEDYMAAAKREFKEELGIQPPSDELIDLGTTKQSGKTNYIWAVEGDVELNSLSFNSMFTMEWPPRSGKTEEFPESDKAAWFELVAAKTRLFKAQVDFIDRLAEKLNITLSGDQTTEARSGDQQISLL